MRKLKKFFSALMAMSILLCSGVTFVNTAVSATGDVVFELDAATLTDKSGNGIATFQLGTIVKGSFLNEAGDTVSYMTTGNAGDTLNNSSTAGMLRLTDDEVTKLKDYTVETWMRYKLPADNVYPRMFLHTNGTANLFTYELPNVPTGDKAYVLGKQNLQNSVDQNTVAEQWVHYVFTFDTIYDEDGNATSVAPNIYVNGVDKTAGWTTKPSITDATALALLGTGTEFTIGGSAANGGFARAFSGDFATFKIYSTVKTGTEIKALYESSAADYVEGLDVEEGGVLLDIDPATLTDRSGNEIPVSKLGTITTGSFTNNSGDTISYMTTGNAGDTLNNSSTAGTLRITDKNIIGLEDYTIETWMRYKKPADGIYPRIFRHSDGTKSLFTYEMPSVATGDKAYVLDKQNLINTVDQNTVAEQWVHYVFTFDTIYDEDGNATSVAPNIYVNGVDKTAGWTTKPSITDATALALLGTGTEFTIGGSAANGGFARAFSGDFATFKIYDGIKTKDEITALYNAKKDSFTRRAEDGEVIFDLDMTNLTDSSETNVPVNMVGSVATNSFVNRQGATVNYISPNRNSTYTDTKADSAGENSGSLWIADEQIIRKSSYTVELWARYNRFTDEEEYDYPEVYLFKKTAPGQYSDTQFTRWSFEKDKCKPCVSVPNTAKSALPEEVFDNWTHYVMTYNETFDAAGTRTSATADFYINGKKCYTGSTAVVSDMAYADTVNALYIAGQSKTSVSGAFPGDIAAFTMYQGILSEAEVGEKYEAKKDSFIPGDVVIMHTTSFADETGSTVTSLDDVETLQFSYRAYHPDTTETIMAVAYSNGAMASCQSKELLDSDTINVPITDNIDTVKFFVWDMETLTPETEVIEIGKTSGYVPPSMPLTISGEFLDLSGNKVTHLEGQTQIIATVTASDDDAPQDLTAKLSLMRNGEVQNSDIKPLTFNTDGKAETNVQLSELSAQEGDVLTLQVTDGDKLIYFTKEIEYSDPSKIVDILLVAGQSNAMGMNAAGSQSIRPEADTVYFNTIGNNSLVNGNQGWCGSLGKTWHDETGRTVLVVKAAWGGTGFKENTNGTWVPDYNGLYASNANYRRCYEEAKELYNAAVKSVRDNSEYTLGRCVYFWLQGENEEKSRVDGEDWTADQYMEAFGELRERFEDENVFGDGQADSKLTHGGILPVRSSPNSGMGFPANLKLTGVRIAEYYMTSADSNLQMVSDATEHWYSDLSVRSWFKTKYRNKTYPTGTRPSVIDDVLSPGDAIHYTQKAHNELGIQAANSMLAYLNGGTYADGISLITENGIQHYSDGDSIYLTEGEKFIPTVAPACGKKVSFTLSGTGAVMDKYGVITAEAALLNNYATLTARVEGQPDMTFKIYSPLVDETISISSIKDNKAAIYTLTTDDGLAYTNKYLDAKLKELNLVGTMGLVPDYLGTVRDTNTYLTWDEAKTLINSDDSVWDVANHTKAHLQGEFLNLTDDELETEIDGGREILKKHFPNEKIMTMYTPGGQTSSRIKNKVKENHLLLRWAGGGLNSLPISADGLLGVKVYGIGGYANITTAEQMNKWVDDAISSGSWLAEMWHGVGDTDAASWQGNISTEETDMHLEYVAQLNNEGKIWVTTLDEAAIYATQRLNSRISMIESTQSGMKFTLTDELEDAIYDCELTLNITLPEEVSSVASVTEAGKAIQYSIDGGILTITVLPDSGEIQVLY